MANGWPSHPLQCSLPLFKTNWSTFGKIHKSTYSDSFCFRYRGILSVVPNLWWWMHCHVQDYDGVQEASVNLGNAEFISSFIPLGLTDPYHQHLCEWLMLWSSAVICLCSLWFQRGLSLICLPLVFQVIAQLARLLVRRAPSMLVRAENGLSFGYWTKESRLLSVL